MWSQVDVAPESQPAASSLASEASVHKLAELAQSKAATEPATSNVPCSRSSTLALGSVAASSPSFSAFENAPSMAASEPAAADDTASGIPMYPAAFPAECSFAFVLCSWHMCFRGTLHEHQVSELLRGLAWFSCAVSYGTGFLCCFALPHTASA